MAHKIPLFSKSLLAQLTIKTVSMLCLLVAFQFLDMIKGFPALITCGILAPFDVVFIVFLPFEFGATGFTLALCKDPSIKVLSQQLCLLFPVLKIGHC